MRFLLHPFLAAEDGEHSRREKREEGGEEETTEASGHREA